MAADKQKTVLIVDDDVSVSEYLDVAIKSAGHRTVLAYDGEVAMRKFRERKPDLVILDALIPKMDGFDVCCEIKKTPAGRKTPVVMMTGIYTKRSYRQQALNRSGAVEYIVKPFGISEIWRVLKDHLGPGAAPSSSRPAEEAATAPAEALSEIDEGMRAFFERGDMTLGHGTPFSQLPLAVLLRDLYLGRKTGLLFLRSEKRTSIIYLDRGEIVFVRSNDLSLRLDRVLVRSNKITEEQYGRAQELFKAHRGRRRMGEILIGMGVLSQDDLEEALRFQLQLHVARAFQWSDGVSYFVEGDLPNREDVVSRMDTRAIIFMGVKNMRDEQAILRHLPEDRTVLRQAAGVSADVAETIGLTAFEGQILSVIDGTKTLRQVRSMGKLANVDINALLFAFLCTGLVKEDRVNSAQLQVADPEEGASPEAVSPSRRRAFKGNLVSRPIGHLLHALYASRKTGVLTAQRQGMRKWLQVERGEVIFAGSDDPDDRIGRVLVRANLVSEGDLEDALAENSHREGKRIGRVLVDGGHITLEELYWAVVFQVQRVVLSLFAWEDGDYLFREGPLPTRETIILELNTPNLILEGVRSIPEKALERRLPGDGASVRRHSRTDELARRVGLSSPETAVLEAVGAASTVGALVGSGIGTEGEIRRTLYAFATAGILEISLPEGDDAAVEEEEVAVAAAGAPAGVTRPGPRAGAPANPPIPFPAAAPPAAVPRASGTDETQVPRFLYEELLAERRDLEDQILELYSDNCTLQMRLRQAADRLQDMLGDDASRVRVKEMRDVLALLCEGFPPEA